MCKSKNNLIIKDTYNANPTSMEVSLKSFNSLICPAIAKKGKVLILGDMRELGKDAPKEHKRILEQAIKMKPKRLYLVGEEFSKAARQIKNSGGCEILCFQNKEELALNLKKSPLKGYAIFIKGSHSIGLENIFELL
jgi:UDP-N-acetylmuramoyl-tripeptide--D-alanyl-D-alanine ligase